MCNFKLFKVRKQTIELITIEDPTDNSIADLTEDSIVNTTDDSKVETDELMICWNHIH